MIPERFPEKNKTLLPPHGMEDCEPLDIWTDGMFCTSRWRMSWRERISALVFGRVWVRVWSWKPTQPPIALDACRSIFVEPPRLERARGFIKSLFHRKVAAARTTNDAETASHGQ